MKKVWNLLTSVILLAMLASACAGPAATPDPLEKAFAGIGGKATLEKLSSFSYEASGTRGLLFEGYQPLDAPKARETSSFTVKVSQDFKADKLRLDYTRNIEFLRKATTNSSEIINGQLGYIAGSEASAGGPAGDMVSARWAAIKRQQRLTNPQLVLKEIAANPGMASDRGPTVLDGKPHLLLEVKDNVYPLTYYIDSGTGLISKLATKENDYLRRDVDLEIIYADWQTAAGGLRFPGEISLIYGGFTTLQEKRTNFQANPVLAADLFNFPPEAKPVYDSQDAARGERSAQFHLMQAGLGVPRDTSQTTVKEKEIATGVFFIGGGSHNSLVIEQEKGIVVVEAPLDEARSKAVIAWVKSKWPGKPISYIISDHHHIDHSAGMRAYIAEGATAVLGVAAEEFFTKNFAAKSTIEKDALELNPKTAVIKAVPLNGSVSLPDTLRPVSVYHVPSTHAVDLVMAFLENEGVVFISDIYTPPGDPGPSAKELNDAIVKYGLKVNTIAGGHGGDVIAYDTFKSKLPQ